MSTTILIVDDNIEIIEFLCSNLKSKYSILNALNGATALDIIGKNSVHLIVSDVMMPVMNGFELCKKIKSSAHYCHIPVILLTAKKTLDSHIEGLEKGADAYIEKPFSPKHLQAQIENLLDNRNKLKEFFAASPLVHIKTTAYSKADEEFLEKINDVIEENIQNPDLDVEQLANAMYMSRPTFYRKTREVSDVTPNELIKLSRLKKAALLLREGKLKIYEISEMVGFTSQHHFARCFIKQFGMTASEFQMKSFS